jgi:hypothetical protein
MRGSSNGRSSGTADSKIIKVYFDESNLGFSLFQCYRYIYTHFYTQQKALNLTTGVKFNEACDQKGDHLEQLNPK